MRIRFRRVAATITHRASPAWLFLGGVVCAYVVASLARWLLSTDGSVTIRYAGTALQIFGLLTVAFGLRQTRRLFPGRPSVGGRLRDWFRELASAFGRPRTIEARGEVVGGAVTVSGKARVRMGAGQDAPLEHRLEILEQNVKRFEDEFDAEIRDLSSKIGHAEEGVRREADERKRADDSVTRVIEEATIGGLTLEVVGLLWLMLGVVGQGCSDEIAKLLVFMRLARS